MIALANTSVDPGAMVVEPLHTSVANNAVLGPDRANDAALRAQLRRRHILQQVPKWNLTLQVAWILKRCKTKGN